MWEKIKNSQAIHTSQNSSLSFTGTGTDDLAISGNSSYASTRQYRVQIDGDETYKWSNDNGSTWEKTEQEFSVNQIIPLVNLQGEDEGIRIAFGSVTGHVLGDYWNFTTAGMVVPNGATLLGLGRVSQNADTIILKGEYLKGTEDGLQIYITLPLWKNGSVEYRPSRPLDVAGTLVNMPEIFELQSSANFSYIFSTYGNEYFKVYAISKGGTESGVFTCFVEQNRQIL